MLFELGTIKSVVSSFKGWFPMGLASIFITLGLLKSELEGILSDAEDILQDENLSDEEKVDQLQELILEGDEEEGEPELEEEV
jgi:hypothetical protein